MSVLASPESLDRWRATQWATTQSNESLDSDRANGLAASIRDFRRLCQANRELMHDLTKAMEGLRGESEELVRNVSQSSKAKRAVPEKPRHFADTKRSRK